MRIIFIDFETYWSATHSLTKMNPIVYMLHPETEVQSIAVKERGQEAFVLFGEDIQAWVASIDWSDVMVVAHNIAFDGPLLAWRYGVNPKMWGCTLSMSKPFFGLSAGGSLAKVADALGVGTKLSLEETNTKGKKLAEFTPSEIEAMREYNKVDVFLCERIFKKLYNKTPPKEFRHIDAVTRMLTEPVFDLDVPLLEAALFEERARKRAQLLGLASHLGAYYEGMDETEAALAVSKTLGSAVKFAALLKEYGIECPTKISPRTGKPTKALAKTDEEFVALQDHEHPIVAMAAQARLGAKSTLLESRLQSFIEVAKFTSNKMPVPQQYHAAHTGRNGGGGASLNLCNLPRVGGNLSDALRNSMIAPSGYKVVVVDLSGIELRVNHILWQVPSSMALFKADREKADLYKTFATALYGVELDAVTKAQRQVAKVAQLGLGYGSGPSTFQKVAKTMGGVVLSEQECVDIVSKWRMQYIHIVQGWKTCQHALTAIARGSEMGIDPWGLMRTDAEGIVLPSGRKIRYEALRTEFNDKTGKLEWVFGTGRKLTRIHGPKMDENLVQALSRDVFKDCLLEVHARTGRYPAHEVYDELVYVVPEAEADDMLATVLDVMRTPPKWWPELLVWAEGDIADSYGAAK
jgi:hypothetical protein